MNGIEDLKLMLESRSTDYGKMRQILSVYLLNVDSRVAKLKTIAKELVDENDAIIKELVDEKDAIRAKLKIAIDSLEKISYGDGTLSDFSGLAELTLAEIREKGGAK